MQSLNYLQLERKDVKMSRLFLSSNEPENRNEKNNENRGGKNPNNKKFNFDLYKKNTINSINEVEYFLNNFNRFIKYLKLYKIIKK